MTGEIAESGSVAMGIEFFGGNKLAAYSFMMFNLLCAPCFAAMGAIKREMNNWKWTAFALGYMCVFAYAVSLVVYQIGMAFSGNANIPGVIAAVIILIGIIYMIVRPVRQKAKK